MVTLTLQLSEACRGKGYWKFNDEFLEDEEFCVKLLQLIKGTKRVYYYLQPAELWKLLKV